MKTWLRTALLGLSLGALPVMGEPDSFGRGSGRDGALTVREPGRVLNRYAQVNGPTAPGDTVLLVADTAGFGPGDLVMVLQATGLVPEPAPGRARPLELSRDAVGQWEFARVSASGEGTLTLSAPLVNAYAARVTQVIRVPEYTRVHIREGAEVRAAPWDGRTGGVVAFLATGEVRNEGTLSATGAGFRGGTYVPEALEPALCLGLSLDARPGARKGEGIAVTRYGPTATGREAVSHGGGGGLCPSAGGGGGGNGGPGGRGGAPVELTGALVTPGGEGGAKLVYSLADRLSFGGGGGSGQGEDELRPEGGAGGGAVLLRAQQLSGRGVIVADGAPGGAAGRGGAGGGGAGGSIHLRFDDATGCGGVSARGGAGGDASPYLMGVGVAGGGGGGGRVLTQTPSRLDCPIHVEAANGGSALNQAGVRDARIDAQPSRDTLALHTGLVEGRAGGDDNPSTGNDRRAVAKPTILSPQNGDYVNTSQTSGLVVNGKAEAGSALKIFMEDGVAGELASVGASGEWSIKIAKPPKSEFTDHLREKVLVQASKDGSNATSAEHSFTVDLITPKASITNRTSLPVVTRDKTIKFEFTHDDKCLLSGSDALRECTFSYYKDVRFDCARDGEAYEACGNSEDPRGSKQYDNLGEGAHSFLVRARDKINEGPDVRYDWVVDRTNPVVTISKKPPSRTGDDTASFEFRSNEAGGSFECVHKRNGSTLEVTSNCTSPRLYSGLTEGPHEFLVTARDDAGNVSEPASSSWVVDHTGPEAIITSTPPASTNSKNAEFAFTTRTVEQGATFECALDTGPFGNCPGTKSYSALGNGKHTFYVRAIDDVSNKGPTLEFKWTVDFTPPITAIKTAPDKFTTNRTAKFVFSADKTQVSYLCALSSQNGGGFEQCGSTGEKTYSALDDGTYTFRVQAIDNLNNVEQTPVSYEWTVDTTPPELDITEPSAEGTSSTPFVVFVGKSDKGADVLLFIDGSTSAVTLKADPFNGTWRFTSPSQLDEGPHVVRVEVIDWAGRKTTKEQKFKVNTFRPETQITSGPPKLYKSGIARFSFSAPNVPENRQDDVEFTCQLDAEKVGTRCEREHEYYKLKNGPHKLEVRAWLDGNEDTSAAIYTWEVRIDPPLPPEIRDPVEGKLVNSGSPVISGTAVPNGKIYVYIDSKQDDKESGIVPVNERGEWTFRHSQELEPGLHTVDALAEDELGNKSDTRSATVSFVVEKSNGISGYGEGGGGLSCSASGSVPGSMLLWSVLSLASRRRRRC